MCSRRLLYVSTEDGGADWNEGAGALSPDGRWVAYPSDETGKDRFYVRSFPGRISHLLALRGFDDGFGGYHGS